MTVTRLNVRSHRFWNRLRAAGDKQFLPFGTRFVVWEVKKCNTYAERCEVYMSMKTRILVSVLVPRSSVDEHRCFVGGYLPVIK
jgi:hypothetical protein